MRYYVDTCIWRDYWENCSDGIRPLGEFAFNFFKNLDAEDVVYYSDLIIAELSIKYTPDQIQEIFSIVKAQNSVISSEILHKAYIIAKAFAVPVNDAIHALVAQKFNCILITRDNHFMQLSHLCTMQKPEDC